MANPKNRLHLRRRALSLLAGAACCVCVAQSVKAEVPTAPPDWLSVPEWTEDTTALGEAKATRAWTMIGALGIWCCFGVQLWRTMTAKVSI